MSYDVALALRGAQSYGLNVKGATVSLAQNFNYPYGMDFNLSTPSTQSQMIFFADSNPSSGNNSYGDGICSGSNVNSPCVSGQSVGDTVITTYTLARGGLIKCLFVSNNPITSSNSCSNSNGVSNTTFIDITFKRPDPNAIIVSSNGSCNSNSSPCAYAQIQVEDASKTSTRSIVVNQTGLIAVQNQ